MRIKDFDNETIRVLKDSGCPSAEEQAVLRYGADWRYKYLVDRNKERKRKFPMLNKFFRSPVL